MYLFYTFKINYRLNVIYPFLSNLFLFILLSDFEKIKEPEDNASIFYLNGPFYYLHLKFK